MLTCQEPRGLPADCMTPRRRANRDSTASAAGHPGAENDTALRSSYRRQQAPSRPASAHTVLAAATVRRDQRSELAVSSSSPSRKQARSAERPSPAFDRAPMRPGRNSRPPGSPVWRRRESIQVAGSPLHLEPHGAPSMSEGHRFRAQPREATSTGFGPAGFRVAACEFRRISTLNLQ